MVRKPTLLVLIGITLFGCLGGLGAALVRKPHYSTDAIVVVYEMPHDQRELIGPDEAQQIDQFYAAGALQSAVTTKVLAQFPGMTEAQLHAAIQITIIAYSPLTRITATAETPQKAADLANAVAADWTALADSVNANAWAKTVDTLKGQAQDLTDKINETQQSIDNAHANGTDTSALRVLLAVQSQALARTNATLLAIDQLRLAMTDNALISAPATPESATRSPDAAKLAAEGAAGGLGIGFLYVLWLLYRQRRALPNDDAVDDQRSSVPARRAFAGVHSGDAYDGR